MFTVVPQTAPIYLKGIEIPRKRTLKYLGVALDARLNYKINTTENIAQASRAMNALHPIFNKKHIEKRTETRIYTSYVRSILA